MKCQNANNYAFYIGYFLPIFSFLAHAHIEHTVIAYYDLNAGRNAHYQLILSPQHKDTALTLIPLEHNNQFLQYSRSPLALIVLQNHLNKVSFILAMRKRIITISAYQISVPLLLSITFIRGGFI